MTPDPISDLVVAGDPRAIARAISMVEDDAGTGAALISRLYPRTGRAYLVGVTGAPGVGKSTLVDRMVTEARRAGRTVGVLAVDPTSPFSGGAILGDRVRMSTHANDPGVFVRSMATRGHLGGLAAATSDAALVLDAAGKDFVVIETVGVGQDEVDIVRGEQGRSRRRRSGCARGAGQSVAADVRRARVAPAGDQDRGREWHRRRTIVGRDRTLP